MNPATPPEAESAPTDFALGQQTPPDEAPRTRTALRDLLARAVASIQAANAAGVPF